MKNMYARSLLKLQQILINQNYLNTKIHNNNNNVSQNNLSSDHLIPLNKISDIVFEATLNKNPKNYKLKSLVRVSEQQMRNLLKISCPVSKQDFIKNNNLSISIDVFKNIRKTFNIDQQRVCSKCPFSKVCQKANIIPQDRKKATLNDLLLLLYALIEIPQDKYTILRWTSAYKIVEYLTISLKDDNKLIKQAILYNSIVQKQQNDSYKPKKKVISAQKNQEIFGKRKYSFN